jgi:hypothetical protein
MDIFCSVAYISLENQWRDKPADFRKGASLAAPACSLTMHIISMMSELFK